MSRINPTPQQTPLQPSPVSPPRKSPQVSSLRDPETKNGTVYYQKPPRPKIGKAVVVDRYVLKNGSTRSPQVRPVTRNENDGKPDAYKPTYYKHSDGTWYKIGDDGHSLRKVPDPSPAEQQQLLSEEDYSAIQDETGGKQTTSSGTRVQAAPNQNQLASSEIVVSSGDSPLTEKNIKDIERGIAAFVNIMMTSGDSNEALSAFLGEIGDSNNVAVVKKSINKLVTDVNYFIEESKKERNNRLDQHRSETLKPIEDKIKKAKSDHLERQKKHDEERSKKLEELSKMSDGPQKNARIKEIEENHDIRTRKNDRILETATSNLNKQLEEKKKSLDSELAKKKSQPPTVEDVERVKRNLTGSEVFRHHEAATATANAVAKMFDPTASDLDKAAAWLTAIGESFRSAAGAVALQPKAIQGQKDAILKTANSNVAKAHEEWKSSVEHAQKNPQDASAQEKVVEKRDKLLKLRESREELHKQTSNDLEKDVGQRTQKVNDAKANLESAENKLRSSPDSVEYSEGVKDAKAKLQLQEEKLLTAKEKLADKKISDANRHLDEAKSDRKIAPDSVDEQKLTKAEASLQEARQERAKLDPQVPAQELDAAVKKSQEDVESAQKRLKSAEENLLKDKDNPQAKSELKNAKKELARTEQDLGIQKINQARGKIATARKEVIDAEKYLQDNPSDANAKKDLDEKKSNLEKAKKSKNSLYKEVDQKAVVEAEKKLSQDRQKAADRKAGELEEKFKRENAAREKSGNPVTEAEKAQQKQQVEAARKPKKANPEHHSTRTGKQNAGKLLTLSNSMFNAAGNILGLVDDAINLYDSEGNLDVKRAIGLAFNAVGAGTQLTLTGAVAAKTLVNTAKAGQVAQKVTRVASTVGQVSGLVGAPVSIAFGAIQVANGQPVQGSIAITEGGLLAVSGGAAAVAAATTGKTAALAGTIAAGASTVAVPLAVASIAITAAEYGIHKTNENRQAAALNGFSHDSSTHAFRHKQNQEKIDGAVDEANDLAESLGVTARRVITNNTMADQLAAAHPNKGFSAGHIDKPEKTWRRDYGYVPQTSAVDQNGQAVNDNSLDTDLDNDPTGNVRRVRVAAFRKMNGIESGYGSQIEPLTVKAENGQAIALSINSNSDYNMDTANAEGSHDVVIIEATPEEHQSEIDRQTRVYKKVTRTPTYVKTEQYAYGTPETSSFTPTAEQKRRLDAGETITIHRSRANPSGYVLKRGEDDVKTTYVDEDNNEHSLNAEQKEAIEKKGYAVVKTEDRYEYLDQNGKVFRPTESQKRVLDSGKTLEVSPSRADPDRYTVNRVPVTRHGSTKTKDHPNAPVRTISTRTEGPTIVNVKSNNKPTTVKLKNSGDIVLVDSSSTRANVTLDLTSIGPASDFHGQVRIDLLDKDDPQHHKGRSGPDGDLYFLRTQNKTTIKVIVPHGEDPFEYIAKNRGN